MGSGLLSIDDKREIHEELEQIEVAELFDIVPLLQTTGFLGFFVDVQQFVFEGIPDPLEIFYKGFDFFSEDGFPGGSLLLGGP